MSPLQDFAQAAKGLAKNPLGIIALFIVLIYGFASMVLGLNDSLQGAERLPLVWFLVLFPCLVLAVFTWLVSKHHTKLYAPSDFKADEAFIEAARASVRAAVSLGAAGARLEAEGGPQMEIEQVAEQVFGTVGRTRSPIPLQRSRAKVLWVDDRPDNNRFERQAFEAVGVDFELALSTEEALSMHGGRKFEVIISDMGRPPDSRAGYTLLNELRASGDQTPFFIYASSRAPEHVAEARRRGAQGATNRPDELFSMVTGVLDLQ